MEFARDRVSTKLGGSRQPPEGWMASCVLYTSELGHQASRQAAQQVADETKTCVL